MSCTSLVAILLTANAVGSRSFHGAAKASSKRCAVFCNSAAEPHRASRYFKPLTRIRIAEIAGFRFTEFTLGTDMKYVFNFFSCLERSGRARDLAESPSVKHNGASLETIDGKLIFLP